VSRPHRDWGKADGGGEVMGTCTHHTAGVKVQASRDRHAEITSGTTIFQQGLAATCKDARYKGTESRARRLVGRMSP
jgi:hypothetical protein